MRLHYLKFHLVEQTAEEICWATKAKAEKRMGAKSWNDTANTRQVLVQKLKRMLAKKT